MRILVIEDDDKIRRYVEQALRAERCAVDVAADGDEGLWLAGSHPYDVIVMDLMLPTRDGMSVLRQLRRSGSTVPVLILTARGGVEDRVSGLNAGADDYLAKPFAVSELIARVHALGRRQRPHLGSVLKFEDLELDLLGRRVSRGGQRIDLTPREFALLELLLQHAPNPVSKAVIIEKVWDRCFDSETALVNVHVSHLRKKLELPGSPPLIRTIRGVGFALGAEPA
ncbi:response regulator transcription factor [Dokdonella soli]|uniref:Response regulator transcription factor n=1 Tax=Dokdonella soli TaxID=529810 RepID=A0ABN1IBJ2_9GAMM